MASWSTRLVQAGEALDQAFYESLPEKDRKKIDDAVLRILRQKLRFAQVGEPGRYGPQAVFSAEHRQLARRVAQESIVLLKNENQTLPLKSSVKKVAVIVPPAVLSQRRNVDYLQADELARSSVKDAVAHAVELSGRPRREVYARALERILRVGREPGEQSGFGRLTAHPAISRLAR